MAAALIGVEISRVYISCHVCTFCVMHDVFLLVELIVN